MAEIDEVLDKRAQLLAKPVVSTDFVGDQLTLLEFNLGSERYALEVGFAKEVHPYQRITRLMEAPSFIKGVMNIRQRIVSIVDLREMLLLPPFAGTGEQKVLVLEHNGIEFALLVDDVVGTRELALSALQPAPATFKGIGQELLKGVTEDQLIILDGECFFTKDDFIVHKEVG